MIEKLQFISQQTDQLSHLQSISAACKAGVKWVQLRVKEKSAEEVLALALEAREICKSYGAKLIINDHPAIALKAGADGVHLGKLDMPVAEARKMVGDMIVGATANTFEDIEAHARSGADYVGLGPFRFTATKKNLSPILGLEGYRAIMKKCRQENIHIPIVAIGGIQVADIAGLRQAGLHGIAVSSLLVGAASAAGLSAAAEAGGGHPHETVEMILRELEKNTIAHA
jgi:thiamine-phosphate pyrophosphorylase